MGLLRVGEYQLQIFVRTVQDMFTVVASFDTIGIWISMLEPFLDDVKLYIGISKVMALSQHQQ